MGALDIASEILEDAVNAVRIAEAPPNPVDTAKGDGARAGAAAAQEDLRTGVFDSERPGAYFPSLSQAADYEAAQTPLSIPGLGPPWLTALEVALTPTPLNLGETTYAKAGPAHDLAYEQAYKNALIDDFDRRMDERFTMPAPAEPIQGPPSLLDLLVPPLTSAPEPYSSPQTPDYGYVAPSYTPANSYTPNDYGSNPHSYDTSGGSGYTGGSDGGSSSSGDSGGSGGSD